MEVNGFEVFASVKNGQEAVDVYENSSEKPDIILMDHRMPVKDGLSASKEILAQNPEAKIIFITADASVRSCALSIGVSRFLDKIITARIIIDEINSLI